MQGNATDVTTYLSQVPEPRRAALTRLRELCLKTLVGYEEGMEYGMPGYRKDGIVEVSFASQKTQIALYVLKEAVVNAHRAEFVTASIGKGCIRYSKPEKLDFAVIEKLLIATQQSDEVAC